MHYVCLSLVQNAVCMCCDCVGNCDKGFVWRENWRTWNSRKHGDTNKEVQVWRGSLVSLSFQPCSPLHRCLWFSLSHHWRSQSSYHYALHCSHEHGMAASQHGHVQRISITWMGQTRSVDRSMHMVPWTTLVWGSVRLAPIILSGHVLDPPINYRNWSSCMLD